eukprot:UN23046
MRITRWMKFPKTMIITQVESMVKLKRLRRFKTETNEMKKSNEQKNSCEISTNENKQSIMDHGILDNTEKFLQKVMETSQMLKMEQIDEKEETKAKSKVGSKDEYITKVGSLVNAERLARFSKNEDKKVGSKDEYLTKVASLVNPERSARFSKNEDKKVGSKDEYLTKVASLVNPERSARFSKNENKIVGKVGKQKKTQQERENGGRDETRRKKTD